MHRFYVTIKVFYYPILTVFEKSGRPHVTDYVFVDLDYKKCDSTRPTGRPDLQTIMRLIIFYNQEMSFLSIILHCREILTKI